MRKHIVGLLGFVFILGLNAPVARGRRGVMARIGWGKGFCAAIAAAAFFAGFAGPVEAGNVELNVVNIETPQGVKIWTPESVYAKKGDTVTLTLINKLDTEHGYEIEAFGIKEVVDGKKTKKVSFKADKAGIFPIKCHLHPPHVSGQLVVLE